MVKIIFIIFLLGVVVFVLGNVLMAFSPERREIRKAAKEDGQALRSSRERANIAERALREIAAGAEYPIFVAGDALNNIEKTYTKEINK